MDDLVILDELIEKYFSLSDEDVCLCGSGKKFSECHKISASYSPIYPGSLNKHIFRKSSQRLCFYKDDHCTDTITSSHSIPRQSLVNISTNGHVLRFIHPDHDHASMMYDYMQITPTEVGINEVSCFNGFCSFHDNTVFAPIEKTEYTSNTTQNALLLFRAICKELYVKHDMLKFIDINKKVLTSKKDIIYRHLLNVYNRALYESKDV